MPGSQVALYPDKLFGSFPQTDIFKNIQSSEVFIFLAAYLGREPAYRTSVLERDLILDHNLIEFILQGFTRLGKGRYIF